jgi:hypothetical protein
MKKCTNKERKKGNYIFNKGHSILLHCPRAMQGSQYLFGAQHIFSDAFSTCIATTQPTTQNNLKQFCWGGIIIGKKPTTTTTTPPHHHTTGYHYNLSNPGS